MSFRHRQKLCEGASAFAKLALAYIGISLTLSFMFSNGCLCEPIARYKGVFTVFDLTVSKVKGCKDGNEYGLDMNGFYINYGEMVDGKYVVTLDLMKPFSAIDEYKELFRLSF